MTEPKPSDIPGDEPVETTDEPAPGDETSAAEASVAEAPDEEPFEEGSGETEPEEDEASLEEAPPPPSTGRISRRPPPPAPAAARTPTPSELAVRVDDRISAAFVIVVAVVFAAILLWGVLGGHRGLLSPRRTPAPSPSPVPSASASESPSASAAVSPSGSIVGPTPSEGESPAPSESPNPSPSGS